MVSEQLQSPNAIPPRTSSTGVASSSSGPARSVLHPLVQEGDWLSKHRRMGSLGSQADTLKSVARFGGSLWSAEKEKIILGPFEYIAGHGGKDFRGKLISAFNVWLKVPEDRLRVITKVIGMLHNASLLVDDVEDSSSLRRGIPVAHHVFGTAQTLNSGNYVYFCALQELLKLNNPKLVQIYADELCNLHRGQGMDLYWRDTLTCPTEEDYLEMVGNKTGGLFRLSIKLMQAESTSGKDCLPLVDIIGLIFQIRDDYLNLSSSEYAENKGLCEDLTEGKFSFPIIHAIRRDPSNLQLVNILRQKTEDPAVKRYAVDYMRSQGSFEYSRKVVSELIARAVALTKDLDDGGGGGEGQTNGEGKGVLAILDMFSIEEK